MTYYRITESTQWVIEAINETDARMKIFFLQGCPDPVQNGVIKTEEITESEFHE